MENEDKRVCFKRIAFQEMKPGDEVFIVDPEQCPKTHKVLSEPYKNDAGVLTIVVEIG